jgi:hypothetical protein
MVEAGFKNITIVKANKNKSRKDPGSEDLWYFFFNLSSKLPSEWVGFFNEVYFRRRQTSTAPPAGINGQDIFIVCPRNADLQLHFDNLKLDVAATNQKYEGLLQKQDYDGEGKERTKGEERRALMESLDRFHF